MARLRLGWNWHRPNDFQGPDQRALKDTFLSLQKSLNFPYVGLSFSGTHDMTTGLASPAWVVKSSAVSPFVPGDPFSLWRSTPRTVQVPREFDTWMLVGAAAFNTALGAVSAVTSSGFLLSDEGAIWIQHTTGNAGSRTTASIERPVRAGTTIQVVVASTDTAEDLIAAEAWMHFLPLG